MEHKLAHLLRAAAADADAKFTKRGAQGYEPVRIETVMAYPNECWVLVEKPDPYAELKKAYAEGKTIQSRIVGCAGHQDWTDCIEPCWSTAKGAEYRIKQQTVTKWLWSNSDGAMCPCMCSESEQYHEYANTYPIKLEWSATTFEVTE